MVSLGWLRGIVNIMEAPEYCPHCGVPVPVDAKACPRCGSCEETGWSNQADEQALDLPGANFDYDDFVASEFGEETEAKKGPPTWVVVVALILLLYLTFGFSL